MNQRMERDEYFMSIAKLTALRATCLRKKVGAVAIKDNRIVMSGYNGSPSGAKHCSEIGCLLYENHCIRCVHAEANIIYQCAKEGISLKGAKIYCTVEPCYICLMAMISAGITEVLFEEERIDSRTNPELYHLIKFTRLKNGNGII